MDVINTMMDPSIPGTVPEYDEWGNPSDFTTFFNILHYCPYSNLPVNTVKFPDTFIRSGLNDVRVQYWGKLYVLPS